MGEVGRGLLLSSAYWAPVQHYAKLLAHDVVLKEHHEHFVKQTYRNRCIIAAADGPLILTVPVERGNPKAPICDIRISDHGNWRHLHWNAFVSAYKNSPFFEYYADDFVRFYEQKYNFLVDFNEEIERTVCELLGITPKVIATDHYAPASEWGATDYRSIISPKADLSLDPSFTPTPYYQVFQDRHGFLPNLSIADLLFNMGPEARIVLRESSPL